MRRNLYILAQCTFLLFITLLVNGCSLHEEPEMTPEGELGVDPTAVTLNLNLAMNLSLAERAPVTITRASETNYLRRFIVEAYLDRQVAARQTVYEEDFNRASLSVSMKLHARNYRILVLPMPKLIIVIPSACAEVILASRPNTGTLNLSAKSSTYLLKLVRRMYSPKSFKLLFV